MWALKSNSRVWAQLARRLLPDRMQEHLQELRTLSRLERRVHLEVTLRRIARTPPPIPAELRATDTVLFVCHGNIIRSALAEALLRRHATALGAPCERVWSAGLSAHEGRGADPRAVAAASALGVDLGEHRAQLLTRALVDAAQVIYVMDRLNEAQLLSRFRDAGPKLRRLGALAQLQGSDVIVDPYALGADAVIAVAERIDRATRVLAAELSRRASGHSRQLT